MAALASPLSETTTTPVVTIGGAVVPSSDVLFSGLAPGFPSLYQVNVKVPTNAQTGNVTSGSTFLRETWRLFDSILPKFSLRHRERPPASYGMPLKLALPLTDRCQVFALPLILLHRCPPSLSD